MKLNNKFESKKLVISSMLVALAVSLSSFSIPIGASKCFPIQHLINVIAAVFLGPLYGTGAAFCTSLIRNLIGTGSLLAFPGSMVGAFLAGYLYQHTRKFFAACIGEVLGTGILGAVLCYPVATMLMGKEAAVFAYVIPFLLSTGCGTAMAFVLLGVMEQSGIIHVLQNIVRGKENRE